MFADTAAQTYKQHQAARPKVQKFCRSLLVARLWPSNSFTRMAPTDAPEEPIACALPDEWLQQLSMHHELWSNLTVTIAPCFRDGLQTARPTVKKLYPLRGHCSTDTHTHKHQRKQSCIHVQGSLWVARPWPSNSFKRNKIWCAAAWWCCNRRVASRSCWCSSCGEHGFDCCHRKLGSQRGLAPPRHYWYCKCRICSRSQRLRATTLAEHEHSEWQRSSPSEDEWVKLWKPNLCWKLKPHRLGEAAVWMHQKSPGRASIKKC